MLHILLVDDDDSVLKAYRRNLGKSYELTTVDCPHKAMVKIKETPIYDVVVSDIMMPVMDGISFLSGVKEYMPSATRIILSGHVNTDLAIRAVNECAAFRYLTKPTSSELLAATINEAVTAQREVTLPSSDFQLQPGDRALLTDFDDALTNGSLTLHYQPKVALRSGLVCSAEALLRWKHDKYGQVSPAKLIPLVEQSGRGDALAHWVIRAACEQASKWYHEYYIPVKVAVNLSPSNFKKSELVDYIKAVLKETECPPELLELEVTESLKLPTDDWLWSDLCELRDMGVTLSVDDFGAGYASFDHLNRLPASQLKLDSSLLNNVPDSHRNKEVVTLLITLCHSLRLTVVAEGVETTEQADFLNKVGCDFGQGYLYSSAMNAVDFLDWVTAHNFSTDCAAAVNQPLLISYG